MKNSYKVVRIRLTEKQHREIMLLKQSGGPSLNHFVRIAVDERVGKIKKTIR